MAALWLTLLSPQHDANWVERRAAGLTPSEIARLCRLVRPQRRAQFVAGHWLVRYAIAAHRHLDAPAIAIECADDGRALPAPQLGLRASIAHSGAAVAVLVDEIDASGRRLGVDIEAMRADRDIEAIVAAACGLRTASRAAAYLHWARHEAQTKADAGPAGVASHAAIWRGAGIDYALAVAGCAAPIASQVALDDLDGTAVRDSGSGNRQPVRRPVILKWHDPAATADGCEHR